MRVLEKLEKLMQSNPLTVLSEIEKNIREIEQRLMLADKMLSLGDSMLKGDLPPLHDSESQATEDDDFMAHLMAGLREIELAKMKVGCPTMQNIIDEILMFAEEKLEDMKWSTKDIVKAAEDVLREEGVDDWSSLTDAEKTLIKEKIKSRLRNSG